MVHNISHIVRQFKHHWTKQLEDEAIEQACRDEGLRWKNTLLNPITTIKIFFLQILHGNTAMTHLRHLTQLNFTASAYCQARLKLPLAAFQKLCARVSG
ncbi:MAG: IS4 family transposase, partial [Gammaproteobacteria bacterium]